MSKRPKRVKNSNEINRDDFLQALTLLKPGLGSGNIIEQTSHFLFMDDVVCTYNDRVFIMIPFVTGLSCSLEANGFYKLLSKLPSETLALSRKDNQVITKGGKTKFGLPCNDDDQISKMIASFGLEKLKWKKLPEQFLEAVSLCSFSCSTDMTKKVLTGVYVDGAEMLSSDNYRISWYVGKESIDETFIIPSTSVAELKGYDLKYYSLAESWIHFKNEKDLIFSSRLIDGEFPDARTLFPVAKKKQKKLILPGKELKIVIDRAKVLVDGDYILDRQMKLDFSSDRIRCKVEKGERGWFEDEIKFDSGGREFSVVVNPDFLEQALNHVVELSFIEEDRLLLTSDNFKHLISLT